MFNSLFAQAAAFSAAALILFTGLAWFFFFSPMKKRPQTELPRADVMRPSAGLTNLVVVLLGISSFMMVSGGLWDAGMHIQTGEVPGGKDFLWPPHLVIYGGFLLAFVVALLTIGFVAWHGWRSGQRDPRSWVRANPFLGAVAMASTYALLSVPGDALWHELFGIDLTAWSPPHILIALMNTIVTLSAVALWLQKPGAARRPFVRDVVTMFLMATTLNVLYLIGVLEWETINGRSAFVAARPLWLYPLVGGVLALMVLLLVKKLTHFPWAATLTALLFYVIRLGISFVLTATGSIAPLLPLVFLLGAFLLDILPWDLIRNGWLRVVAQAGAFTAGYLPVAMLFLAQRNDLPPFTGLDWAAVIGLTLVVGVFLAPLVDWVGRRFVQLPARA